MKNTLLLLALMSALSACSQNSRQAEGNSAANYHLELVKSDSYWKERLTPAAYHVLREQGTERPFSSELLDTKATGTYLCAACNLPLFSSETKFESGTGWPSFYAVLTDSNVVEVKDESLGMVRTEVICGRCGGHLGHVFADGPQPTGLRYCINGVVMDFRRE